MLRIRRAVIDVIITLTHFQMYLLRNQSILLGFDLRD